MPRRAIVLFASLVVTNAALAAWYPRFDNNWVTLAVGETQFVTVTPKWSGISDYGFSSWRFVSDNPAVAFVSGGVDALGSTGAVTIHALAPGKASVRWMRPDGLSLVQIVVGETPLPRIAASATRVTTGKPVTLTALYPEGAYAGYTWYLGRIGDTSQPLGDLYATRELTYTPSGVGTHYVWVSVSTPYTFGVAEQAIEVVQPRRRAARH